MSGCDPTSCCQSDVPDATKSDRAGSDSSEHRTETGTVPAAQCGPTCCCSTNTPSATTHGVGLRGQHSKTRTLSCAQCGNDPEAIVRAFKAGMQAAAWDTYKPCLDATAARETWQAANPGETWHVRRYGE
jgi:hypothetical protein